jgi:hypothetical protein
MICVPSEEQLYRQQAQPLPIKRLGEAEHNAALEMQTLCGFYPELSNLVFSYLPGAHWQKNFAQSLTYSEDLQTCTNTAPSRDTHVAVADVVLNGRSYWEVEILQKQHEMWIGVFNDPQAMFVKSGMRGGTPGCWTYYGGKESACKGVARLKKCGVPYPDLPLEHARLADRFQYPVAEGPFGGLHTPAGVHENLALAPYR